VAKEVTYEQIYQTYVALHTLVQGNMGKNGDGKGWMPQLPLKTILRFKRIMGVLHPVARDFEEVRSALFEEYNYVAGPMSAELRAKLKELLDEPHVIGCDDIHTSDFNQNAELPIAMVGFFSDVSPFLIED
jgi:hypothetical protein